MLPVTNDLLQVLGWEEQEMFPPLIPVHHHGPINVHAAERERQRQRDKHRDGEITDLDIYTALS